MAETAEVNPVNSTALEDTSLVAFMLYKGHKIKEWRSTDNPARVCFDVEGDLESITKDMQNYYNNEQVGIQDYVRCLKEVKSRMYNMKKIQRRENV